MELGQSPYEAAFSEDEGAMFAVDAYGINGVDNLISFLLYIQGCDDEIGTKHIELWECYDKAVSYIPFIQQRVNDGALQPRYVTLVTPEGSPKRVLRFSYIDMQNFAFEVQGVPKEASADELMRFIEYQRVLVAKTLHMEHSERNLLDNAERIQKDLCEERSYRTPDNKAYNANLTRMMDTYQYFKLHRSDKFAPTTQIDTYLKEKYPEMSRGERERIVTTVNWKPKGGAPTAD